LRALRRIVRHIPTALLLIAGSVAPGAALDDDIEYLGLSRHVRMLGYVPDAIARTVAAASDACVNLRYPTAGETSASLLRLLGAGRPVIITDDGPNAEYPDEVALKVPVDRVEEETLAELLNALHADPELARARGNVARQYVAEQHSMGAAVASYRSAILAAYGVELPDLGELRVAEPMPRITHRAVESPMISTVERCVADRVGGLGIERHDGTLAALARAMVELRFNLPARTRAREDSDMDTPTISPELLEILACPVCKTAVRLAESELICVQCGRHYRIEDGIPIMLVEDDDAVSN
jgi:uncharacterized protein YbaR (Trm112 family)